MTTTTDSGHGSWDELVALGKQFVADRDRSQWPLGDVAIRVAVFAPVAEFADVIGLSYADFQVYRQVAAAWTPDARRYDLPWEWHRVLHRRADRTVVLDAFLADCATRGTSGSVNRLRAFLGTQARSGRGRARPEQLGPIRLVHDVPRVVDALCDEFDTGELKGMIRLLQARVSIGVVHKSA